MSEDLLRIYLGSKSINMIKDLEKLSPSLAKDVRKVCKNAIDECGLLALKSYMSKVPIDLGSLRGLDLGDGFLRYRKSNPTSLSLESVVYILDGPHYSRKSTPIDSVLLSSILNIGISEKTGTTLKRTKNSAAIDGFGSEKKGSGTAGWEDKAFNSFKQQLKGFLHSKDFN